MSDEAPRSRSSRQPTPEALAVGERILLGTVAIVGEPNAGKSTLVNRLTATRETVVHSEPGVTRDRKELVVEWGGDQFALIDTGGVDAGDDGPFQSEIVRQAELAIAQADLVVFLVDAKTAPGAADLELADRLRRSRVPVLLVANKLDDPSRHDEALEYHALGLGEPFALSALHGIATGDLLDEICSRLRELGSSRTERVADEIGVVILGRPNVGKSSLLNALLDEQRAIVSEIPGTTRDSIDIRLERDDRVYRLIDTAGLRRHRAQRQQVEFWSEVRSLEAARRADVALVLVDATEGITEQDLHVADVARRASCATVFVLSKWDIAQLELEDVRERLHIKARQRPPIVVTSALTKRGLERLVRVIDDTYDRYVSRIGTGEFNRLLRDILATREAPLVKGRRLKIYYGAQVQSRPPRFRLTVNDRSRVTRDYAYWLENQLREALALQGVPVILDLVER
jgi:GTP-binding protein